MLMRSSTFDVPLYDRGPHEGLSRPRPTPRSIREMGRFRQQRVLQEFGRRGVGALERQAYIEGIKRVIGLTPVPYLKLIQIGWTLYDIWEWYNTPGIPDPADLSDPTNWSAPGWLRPDVDVNWNTSPQVVDYGTPGTPKQFVPLEEAFVDTAVNPIPLYVKRNTSPTGSSYVSSYYDGWDDAFLNTPEGRGFRWESNGTIEDVNTMTFTDGHQRHDWWYRPAGVDPAEYIGPDGVGDPYPVLVPGGHGPNIYRHMPAGAEDYRPRPVQKPLPRIPDEWQWSDAPPGAPPPARHRREPPRRAKEQKTLTRSARLGILLYKLLDGVSEGAEIVDAIYDALPADVKRRWSKGRQKRGQIDQFGQYGIDGADWKAQALWHNWHKVDVETAIKNIIKNRLEDRLIGDIQRTIPKNTGQAFDIELERGNQITPETGISDFVDWLFEQALDG